MIKLQFILNYMHILNGCMRALHPKINLEAMNLWLGRICCIRCICCATMQENKIRNLQLSIVLLVLKIPFSFNINTKTYIINYKKINIVYNIFSVSMATNKGCDEYHICRKILWNIWLWASELQSLCCHFVIIYRKGYKIYWKKICNFSCLLLYEIEIIFCIKRTWTC